MKNINQIINNLLQKYSNEYSPGASIDIYKLLEDCSAETDNLSIEKIKTIVKKLTKEGYKIKDGELITSEDIKYWETDQTEKKKSSPTFTNKHYLGSSFSIFLQDLDSYPPLSEEKELELLKAAQAGKQEAKENLVLHNIRLVIDIAKKYLNKGLELEDLVDEGIIGLMKAIDKFDYKKGYKLSTYATWWIRQKISRALTDKGRTIRLPVHISETLSRLKTVIYYFKMEYNRTPTRKELAEELNLSETEVNDYLLYLTLYDQEFTSLEMPLDDEEESQLKEMIPDDRIDIEELAIEHSLSSDLNSILNELTDRQKEIIKLRYGMEDGRERTLQEIGKLFDLTRERIRQIETKALNKLRHPKRSRKVKDYLFAT